MKDFDSPQLMRIFDDEREAAFRERAGDLDVHQALEELVCACQFPAGHVRKRNFPLDDQRNQVRTVRGHVGHVEA